MSSNGTWEYCKRTDGTFLDCPIANMKLTHGSEMFMGVHNPSILDIKVAHFAVPDGHFNLQYYNSSIDQYIDVWRQDVLCHMDKSAE